MGAYGTHPEATLKYLAVDELTCSLVSQAGPVWLRTRPAPGGRGATVGLPYRHLQSCAVSRNSNPRWSAAGTGPMDAWYDSATQPAAPPTAEPGWKPMNGLLQLVDQDRRNPGVPGRLSTTTWLLEGDGGSSPGILGGTPLSWRNWRWRTGGAIPRRTLSAILPASTCSLVWACLGPGDDVDKAETELTRHLWAKKHQTRAPTRPHACCLTPPEKHLLRLLYDNLAWPGRTRSWTVRSRASVSCPSKRCRGFDRADHPACRIRHRGRFYPRLT